MNKRVLAIILSLVTCTSMLSGCNSSNKESNADAGSTSLSKPNVGTSDETSSPIEGIASASESSSVEGTESRENIPFKLDRNNIPALQFIYACVQKDLKTIRVFLPWEDTTFVTDEDLEWLMMRSDYANIYGISQNPDDVVTSCIQTNIDPENRSVDFLVNSDYYKVNLELSDTNEWRVKLDFDTEYVTEDFRIELPYTKCCFNDIEITDTYEIDGSDIYKRSVALPVVVRKPSAFTVEVPELGILTLRSGSMKPNSEYENKAWNCYPEIKITAEQEDQLCTAIKDQANKFVSAAEAYAFDNADFDIKSWMPVDISQKDVDNMHSILNSMVTCKKVANGYHKNRSFSGLSLIDTVGDTPVSPFFLYTVTKSGTPIYGCYLSMTCHGEQNNLLSGKFYACKDTETSIDLLFAVEDNEIKFVFATQGCFFDKDFDA